MTLTNYPYTAVKSTCKYNATKGIINTKSYVAVTTNDPVALMNAVAIGPVSAAI